MAYDGDVGKFEVKPPQAKTLSAKSPDNKIEDILAGASAPSDMIDFIIRQRQRASQNASHISVADFERLGVEEEIAAKRKRLDEILGTMSNLEVGRALFMDLLRDHRRLVSEEIDGVNNLIDRLSKKKDKPEDLLKKLRQYRNDLRDYDSLLDWFMGKARTASEGVLSGLVRGFGEAFDLVMRNRANIAAGLGVAFRGMAGAAQGVGRTIGSIARLIPLPF